MADKLVARHQVVGGYTARNGGEMDNNPSAGNKAGGLTTILERAWAPSPRAAPPTSVEVCEYAAGRHRPRLWSSWTRRATTRSRPPAGGRRRNLICFTTGRGSASRLRALALAQATPTALWLKREDDIDLNCGEVVDGTASIDERSASASSASCWRRASGATPRASCTAGQNEFVPLAAGRRDEQREICPPAGTNFALKAHSRSAGADPS